MEQITDQRQWTWKKILLIAVGVLVVGSVGRALLPFDEEGAVDVTGEGSSEHEVQQKPQTVTLNGKKVAIGGQPVIVLNPGLVRPGAKVGVTGSGFDPGSVVDVQVATKAGGEGKEVIQAKAGKDGTLNTSFTMPMAAGAQTDKRFVRAEQRNSKKVAETEAILPLGMGFLELTPEVGRPGDSIRIDAQGFTPGEKIKVYWGRMTGEPSARLQADGGGKVGAQTVKVGVGATGKNVMILVGEKSTTVATASFLMLGLYPSVLAKPYGAKATQSINFSGAGFAPGERVLAFAGGTPLMALQADKRGRFGGANVVMPFGLTGRQSLVFMGEQSRAAATAGFMVLPYSPMGRPSTYAGMPGTSVRFSGSGFAPNEAVHVFTKRTPGGSGELVTAFRVNQRGAAAGVGEYMIPSDAKGKLTFTMVGAKSKGTATVAITVENDGSVKLPPQPKYNLPPSLRE